MNCLSQCFENLEDENKGLVGKLVVQEGVLADSMTRFSSVKEDLGWFLKEGVVKVVDRDFEH